MKLNLVTVVGDFHRNLTLIQMLKHYSNWVDEIYIEYHIMGGRPLMSYLEFTNYLGKYLSPEIREKIHITLRGGYKYDWDKVTEYYNIRTSSDPNAYWIIADCDEFQIWPRSPREIAEECERKGYTFVTGGFLDRIGPNGTFPKIEGPESDLDKLFSLVGFFRNPISGACPNKVVMVKGGQKVCSGQHYAVFDDSTNSWGKSHPLRYPIEECFVEVHHMKWDWTVLERLKETVDSGCKYFEEYARMRDYIIDNERLDILNKKFYIEEYDPSLGYDSYTNWNRIKNTIVKI